MKIYAGRKQIKKEIGSYKRVKSGGEARMNTGKKKKDRNENSLLVKVQ